MKRRQLEMALGALRPVPDPRADLEQYATPPGLVADVLYAALAGGDIGGRTVVDLGCGNGAFALGALLLGAREATGYDVDPRTVEVARANAEALGLAAPFEALPVDRVQGSWDTCLMNPPFGAQRRHADLPFVEAALRVASVTYALHNADTLGFLRRFIEARGGSIGEGQRYKFPIPHLFAFHRRESKAFDVVLLRIEAHGDEGRE